MNPLVLNVFLAILGSMLVPLIPIHYMLVFDTILGRFVLLSLPVILYHYTGVASGIMMGVVSGIIIDRLHDLAPERERERERDEVAIDLSPDYLGIKTGEVVMLEPVTERRKHGVK